MNFDTIYTLNFNRTCTKLTENRLKPSGLFQKRFCVHHTRSTHEIRILLEEVFRDTLYHSELLLPPQGTNQNVYGGLSTDSRRRVNK